MERLRQLRKEKKISMKLLGEVVGVSESTISLYENGKRKPDPDMLVQFADFFGVSVDYLLGRSDNPSPAGEVFAASSKDEDFYGNLSEEGRRELDEYKQYLLQKYGKK